MAIDLESLLSPEYRVWFQAQIDKGRFPSVEDGLNTIFGCFKHEIDDQTPEDGYLSWVKPLLEEADRASAKGLLTPAAEAHAAIRAQLAKR